MTTPVYDGGGYNPPGMVVEPRGPQPYVPPVGTQPGAPGGPARPITVTPVVPGAPAPGPTAPPPVTLPEYAPAPGTQVDTGLLAGQMPTAPRVTPTTYNANTVAPTTATSQGYTAGTYDPTTRDAQGYQATRYDPTMGTSRGYDASQADVVNWGVTPEQTVQNQISGIIAANSPLMQQAERRALEQMNARGLLNSSMAVGAGQSAVYDAAMPIAQADATMYGRAASQNATEGNTTGRFNTGQVNQSREFGANAANQQSLADQSYTNEAARVNAGAENTASQFNVGEANRQGLANQASQNEASQYNTGQTNLASQFGADAANRQTLANQQMTQQANIANQEALNEQARFEADTGFKSQLANQDADVKMALTQYDATIKATLQNADAATRVQLQTIDAQTRVTLADMEARYKNQLQSSAAMSQTYGSLIESITRVMQDKDMDYQAKQDAITNLTTLYNDALSVQETLTGLNLGDILQPTEFFVTRPPAPPYEPVRPGIIPDPGRNGGRGR